MSNASRNGLKQPGNLPKTLFRRLRYVHAVGSFAQPICMPSYAELLHVLRLDLREARGSFFVLASGHVVPWSGPCVALHDIDGGWWL